jgi:hypothetical protein
MEERLVKAARDLEAELPLPRVILTDIAYPKNQDECSALDGNGVLYLCSLAQDQAELPPVRISVISGGETTVLPVLFSILSDQSGASLPAVRAFGPYRADVLCLLPLRLRLKPADIVVDLAGNRGRLKVMSFNDTVPSFVTDLMGAPLRGTGPYEQRLDRFLRREFPGFLGQERANRNAPASAEELAEITARGRKLFQYDQAAWHATDAVRALNPIEGRVTHFIAVEKEGQWTVVFGRLNDSRDKFLVEYEAIQRLSPTDFTAKKLESPREEAGFFLAGAKAIDSVRRDFLNPGRPYNIAVIPVPGNRLFVYLLPAQTEDGVYPLGGDCRYLFSGDGSNLLEKHEMHRVTIEFRSSSNMEAAFHSAVLDDAPEDSDVFHVLARRPSIPEWIVTPKFVYQIKPDGSIQYLMTTEGFLKINEKKD